MSTRNKFRYAAVSIVTALLASVVQMPSAQAETFSFQSSPLVNLDPAGAKINGGFSKFPTGAGLYIQQCVAPVGTARPAVCSDSIQLWVTDSGQPGTTSSKGNISLILKGSITGKGATVDCTTQSCGLFFRLDHTKPTDFSEDKFMPITFKASAATPAPALAADEITVTLNGKVLVKNVPSNLPYRAVARIVAQSKSGLPVTLTSLTPDCTYSNGTFTALKGAGQCALGHATAGDTTYAPSIANYPFNLVPGSQEIKSFPTSVKAKANKVLPRETSFGEEISYASSSKSCSISGNKLKTISAGICKITATAPAKVGMWTEFSEQLSIKVTKTR